MRPCAILGEGMGMNGSFLLLRMLFTSGWTDGGMERRRLSSHVVDMHHCHAQQNQIEQKDSCSESQFFTGTSEKDKNKT